jgi:ribosomal protein S18 acetylase RimI-like enzyme
MITRIHQMNGKQIADLELLMNRCKALDHNTIPVYKHLIDKRHALACNILMYEESTLIGYLRTYFFYTHACEIALMIDPAFRRQGKARKLIREILPVISLEGIHQLIFSTPKDLHKDWFNNLDLTYRGSEFQMQFHPKKPSSIPFKSMPIRLASEQDIEILTKLDDICFPKKNPNAKELFRNLFRTSNCVIFVITQEDNIVGKAHIFKESDRARITDIGVLPDFRGRGIASALIKHCINHALINNKPKITLDVEVNNTDALILYQALGFEIINAHDYWETAKLIPEFGLSSFLQTSPHPENSAQPLTSQKDLL